MCSYSATSLNVAVIVMQHSGFFPISTNVAHRFGIVRSLLMTTYFLLHGNDLEDRESILFQKNLQQIPEKIQNLENGDWSSYA